MICATAFCCYPEAGHLLSVDWNRGAASAQRTRWVQDPGAAVRQEAEISGRGAWTVMVPLQRWAPGNAVCWKNPWEGDVLCNALLCCVLWEALKAALLCTKVAIKRNNLVLSSKENTQMTVNYHKVGKEREESVRTGIHLCELKENGQIRKIFSSHQSNSSNQQTGTTNKPVEYSNWYEWSGGFLRKAEIVVTQKFSLHHLWFHIKLWKRTKPLPIK